MATYVIRPGVYPELPSGLYQWTAVLDPAGPGPHDSGAVERYGHSRVEYMQSARALAAEVLADIRREQGMARAALIQMRLHRS